jgi:arginine deiminase
MTKESQSLSARPASLLITLTFITVSGLPACSRAPNDTPLRTEAPFVTSDTATLEAVIVLPIRDHIFKSSEMGGGYTFFSVGLPRGTIEEHAELVKILTVSGVRVLDLADMLTSAVSNARSEGKLEDWLRETFPATADEAIRRIDELDGRSLLNLRDDHFYLKTEEGTLDPLFPGMSSIYWSRDFAATTPAGFIIGNSQNGSRVHEKAFARLMFGYADELRDIPVVFDAEQEDVYLDGGDIIVLSETEMLLGVDNRSSREAAPKLAETLGMDIYAVAMPPSENRTGLQRQLLHLDSICNIVGPGTAVAVPFFLEKEYSDSNPMMNVLNGLADQMESMRELEDPFYRPGDPEYLRRTADVMSEVGWVTRYQAGTGEEEALELKLVDFLRERGYQVVFVGGEQGDLPIEKYTLERAMYELRWQGANVVQLGPGRIIAYEHNLYTNQALRDAGIGVYTFPGQLLSMRNGGPHCLLMPVLRMNQRTAP